MILQPEIHNANDVTIGYLIDVVPEKIHKWLNLPGIFVKNFPTRFIKRDGSEREMDWLMLVKPDNITLFHMILINVEFQSYPVNKEKIKIMSEYKDYSKTYYGFPVLTIVVITRGFESSEREYSEVATDIFRPQYIYMDDDKVIEKLNNLEQKILNQETLSDNDAIDMVFLPMFVSRKLAEFVTEKIVRLFKCDQSIKGIFRNDIGFSLSLMVRKYFDLTPKGKELLEMMNPEVTNMRMRNVIDYEVSYAIKAHEQQLKEKEEELLKKDNEIAKKDDEIAMKTNEIAEKDEENTILKEILKKHNIPY